jgi:glycosyltransferase involved in cell wall biosynthesis
MKALTLSIVIPVYNEEHHIDRCLEAISKQTVMPDEVIVVDNNCTDKTIEKALRYPFVRVVKESRQGRGYARNAGFDACKSEIIGRIDADSMIATDWSERVLKNFSDTSVAAVTGLGKTNFLPFVKFWRLKILSRAYFWAVHAYFRVNTMWGANSAIRHSYWELVKDQTCLDDSRVHEDQDLSLLIAGKGGKIIQDNHMIITTNGQSYVFLPKFIYYAVLQHRTKMLHKKLGTLTAPNLELLGFWNTLPGRLYSVVPGVIFMMFSILAFPFQALVVARHHRLD